jgi:hypothetical protein
VAVTLLITHRAVLVLVEDHQVATFGSSMAVSILVPERTSVLEWSTQADADACSTIDAGKQ